MGVVAPAPQRGPRTVARSGESVSPLELFFDLVFVFALTQCTALMAADPSWGGLARGLLVLAVLWWAWAAYAWLTSTVDPDEGIVRVVMFAAMGAMLVASLCVPGAFGDEALLFAGAYAGVRVAHLGLYWIASADAGDSDLRRSVLMLVPGSVIGVGLLVAASALDGVAQGALWVVAIVIDLGIPLLFGVAGWRLSPQHFAERHGLVIIIALGESIVAIGVGAKAGVDAGVVTAAVLGIATVACLWWAYFDVVALVAERRMSARPAGVERNRVARDSYSFLHLPMVAGIVLAALGMKKTLEHVGDPLKIETAFALLGGVALYLLAHVAFRLRNVGSLSLRRLVVAVALLLLVPVATQVPALAALGGVAAILVGLIVYETVRYAEARDRVRHAVEEG